MAIFLIRHGETALNAARVMQPPDTPLSPHGQRQAARLGERLRGEGVGAILASDYARAAMTASAVQRSTGAPLAYEPLLRERNFGELRGRPYASFDFNPFAAGYAPPDGESWEAFHARVDRAWKAVEQAAAACPGNLAVVTHGLVCRSVVSRLVQLPPALATQEPAWANTSLTVIEGRGAWEVRLLGCAAHLDPAEEAPEAGPA